MKNFFNRHQNDSVRCRNLEQENVRQRDRIKELEHQLTLQKEVDRRLKDQFDDAQRFAPGIHRLDPQGIKYLFGDQVECREEAGATILSGIAPYQGIGAAKVEFVIPAGMHFETLSQVVDLLQPQAYKSLSDLVETFVPDLASGTFLSCIWEDVEDEHGAVIVSRLTLTPPEQQCFACVYGQYIFGLKLSVEEYLQRVMEYRGEELSEAQIEIASTFCENVLEHICDIWHEKFPGVVFPNQPKEEVDTIVERTD